MSLIRNDRAHDAYTGPPLSLTVLEFALTCVIAGVLVIVGTAVGSGAGNRPLSCVVTNIVCCLGCLLPASVVLFKSSASDCSRFCD